jgi:hypothetical protein
MSTQRPGRQRHADAWIDAADERLHEAIEAQALAVAAAGTCVADGLRQRSAARTWRGRVSCRHLPDSPQKESDDRGVQPRTARG